MRGKIGVPMNAIEHRKQKQHGEYNHKCSECSNLKYVGGRGCPYRCSVSDRPRYYTSKVQCQKFKRRSITAAG